MKAIVEAAALALGWVGVLLVRGIVRLLHLLNDADTAWRALRARSSRGDV